MGQTSTQTSAGDIHILVAWVLRSLPHCTPPPPVPFLLPGQAAKFSSRRELLDTQGRCRGILSKRGHGHGRPAFYLGNQMNDKIVTVEALQVAPPSHPLALATAPVPPRPRALCLPLHHVSTRPLLLCWSRTKFKSQRQLGRRLEEVAKAVGGGYCRLRMPLQLALGVRETVAGHRLGGGVLCISRDISTCTKSIALYGRSRSPCLARAAGCVPLQGCCLLVSVPPAGCLRVALFVTERYRWSFRPLRSPLSSCAFCADRLLCARAIAQGLLPF